MNGDGYTELIVTRVDGGVTNAYVVFGGADGFPESLDVTTDLDGSNGFLLRLGENSLSAFHDSLDAGDFNGDGINDLMLPMGTSLVVVYGSDSGFPESLHAVTELDGTNGVTFTTGDAGWVTSRPSSKAGDFNGDGLSDFVLRTVLLTDEGIGDSRTHVVFGRSGPTPAEIRLDQLDGNDGFTITNDASRGLLQGQANNAGDVNGDGLDDVVITASYPYVADDRPGAAYIIYGRTTATSATLPLEGLTADSGYRIEGQGLLRFEVATADINGDARSDLLFTARKVTYDFDPEDPLTPEDSLVHVPRTFVVFGSSESRDVLDFSELDGSNGFTVIGDGVNERIPQTYPVGDLNGDGFDEMIVYLGSWPDLMWGRASGFDAVIEFSTIEDGERSVLYRANGDEIDFNADGLKDVRLYRSLRPGVQAGIAFGLPGQSQIPEATDGAEIVPQFFGRSHEFVAADADTYEASSIGDLNGDGFHDFLFHLRRATGNTLQIVFGRPVAGDDLHVEGTLGDDRLTAQHGNEAADALLGKSSGDTVSVSELLDEDAVRERALFDGIEELGFDLHAGADSVVFGTLATDGSLVSIEANLGDGNDQFDSSASDVTVMVAGNSGDDTVASGGGRDILNGGSGDDSLDAGAGDDAVLGGNGNDELLGGAGNDRLRGHGGIDTLDGAEGVDMLDGGQHRTHIRDQVSGRVQLTNAGYITLNGDRAMSGGGFSSVSLRGSDGNDEFDSSAFTDGDVTLDGGGGDDELSGDRRHRLTGGEGSDRIDVNGSGEVARDSTFDDLDRLILTGEGQSVDLTNREAPFQPNRLDITGTGSNSLKLRRESLALIEGSHRYISVMRDEDDSLDIGDGWVFQNSAMDPAAAASGIGRGFVFAVQEDALLATMTFGLPVLVDGEISFHDDVGVDNHISISLDEGTDEVVINLVSDLPEETAPTTSANLFRFPIADVSSIEMDLGAGNDRLSIEDVDLPVSVVGGDGVDTVRMIGSDNDDRFMFHATSVRSEMTLEDGWLRLLPPSGELSVRLLGSSLDLSSPDIERVGIEARGGNDRVSGNFGSPVSVTHVAVNLGSGDDSFQMERWGFSMNVNGAAGNDTIYTGQGDDTLIGGSGDDSLVAGDGNDRVRGQGGDDLVSGGAGVDTLDGGGGQTDLADSIDGDVQLTDAGYLTGNGDTARAAGRIRSAELKGGDGNDVLSAQRFTTGSVTLLGGAGNDVLLGSRGDDVLIGGDGNDSLLGAMGDDHIEGGKGDDRLRGHGGHDWLIGGSGNDFLDGATGHDFMLGLDGDDTLIGMNGEDTLSGGFGDDLLDGGSGATALVEGGNVDALLATRDGATVLEGFGVDIIVGRVTVAILVGGATANRIDASGFSGRVVLSGGMGNDTLIGTSRDDTIDGGAARDSIEAGAGNDVVYGGFGDDRIFGGIGDDTLIGEKGDDILNGADGADILIGEKGDDSLNGGSGADTVAGGGNGFTSTDGDRIADGAAEIDESLTVERRGLADGI